MFNIIPLLLILISLGIIISIVVKKFSILANLDVNSIPAEREAKFKEKIIGNRIKRNYIKYYSKFINFLKPLGGVICNFFKLSYKKLLDFKDNYNKEIEVQVDEEKTVEKLFNEAEEAEKNDNLDEAEKKYIELIALDSKNVKAFKNLGKLYFERKDFNESKQTLEHVLRLLEKDYMSEVSEGGEQDREKTNEQLGEVYFYISLVSKSMDNIDGAFVNIDKALEIQPSNPRYLDTKLEISIIKKDKEMAKKTFKKLAETNPENQKLDELKKQIEEL